MNIGGNDRYSIPGDGLGYSINRSVAMLLDIGGDDTYEGKPENRPGTARYAELFAKYDGTDKDVVFLANHDAYGEQEVTLKLSRPAKLFSRRTRSYVPLPVKSGAIRFRLAPAGGAILLFE